MDPYSIYCNVGPKSKRMFRLYKFPGMILVYEDAKLRNVKKIHAELIK